VAIGVVLAAGAGVAVGLTTTGGRSNLAASHASTTSTRSPATSAPASTRTTAVARSTTTTTTKSSGPASTSTTSTTTPATTSTAVATTTTVAVSVPTVTTFPPVLTPTTTPPPPLSQPTAAHPLTVLEIGDSLGEDLGIGMGGVFGPDPLVRVLQDAVGDTGLARPDYYDWPLHLEEELQEYHPGAVVVMLGGNDGQSFDANGGYVGFGTSEWDTIYSERVAQMMDEATKADAHVLWVGMPIMEDPGFSATMETLNAVYEQQAADHAGVTWFPSWSVFTGSAGQYVSELPDASGQEVLLRDSDGVHLAYGGCDRLANAIVGPMESAWHVHL